MFSFAWAIFICLGATYSRLPVTQHMQILITEALKDPDLGRLPSIRIDALVAAVPVDDRIEADETFDRPFVEALREGMSWYMSERGLRVVEEGEDLRLLATIMAYEGDKGWWEWGVDMTLAIRLRRESGEPIIGELRSALMYEDPNKVRNEFKKKYKAQGLYLRYFREILLTQIAIDLSEKLITLIVERVEHPAHSFTPASKPTSEGQGVITIDSSVANAEVLMDGVLIGTTPIRDARLPAGLHVIEIRKRGFEPWKRNVLIITGGSSNLVAELDPADD